MIGLGCRACVDQSILVRSPEKYVVRNNLHCPKYNQEILSETMLFLSYFLHYIVYKETLTCLSNNSYNFRGYQVLLPTINYLLSDIGFQGVGSNTEDLLHCLLPVVAYSTNTEEPAHIYLLEDSLALWQAMVESLSQANPQVLQLLNNMPRLLGEVFTSIKGIQFSFPANLLQFVLSSSTV